MDRSIDLTETNAFQNQVKLSILTNIKRSLFDKFEFDKPDSGLIYQGNFKARQIKKIDSNDNRYCHRCGHHLLPYNFDELCHTCNEEIGSDEQVWFRSKQHRISI